MAGEMDQVGETDRRRVPPRRKDVWVAVLILVIVVGSVAYVGVPAVLRAKKSADLTYTDNDMRNLGIFVFAFEDEWGTFPSEKILLENPDKFRGLREGRSSNALLSMLIAGGFTNSEEIFASPGFPKWSREPDNVVSPPSRMLERGECGMGYVMLEGGRAMNTSDNGGRPLLVAPLEPGSGGADPKFARRAYNRRAVYLRIDQSVKQSQIDDEGRVLLPGNLTLFERGPDTVWEGDIPDVRGPEQGL